MVKILNNGLCIVVKKPKERIDMMITVTQWVSDKNKFTLDVRSPADARVEPQTTDIFNSLHEALDSVSGIMRTLEKEIK